MKKAALFLALCAASFAVGCDDGNGPGTADDVTIGTDIGPDSDPYCRDRKADGTCIPEDAFESSDTPTDSAATETTENKCAPFEKYEGRTWVCSEEQDRFCTSSFWVEEDEDGVEHCAVGCTPPTVFYFYYTDEVQWGSDGFEITDYYFIHCDLKAE